MVRIVAYCRPEVSHLQPAVIGIHRHQIVTVPVIRDRALRPVSGLGIVIGLLPAQLARCRIGPVRCVVTGRDLPARWIGFSLQRTREIVRVGE